MFLRLFATLFTVLGCGWFGTSDSWAQYQQTIYSDHQPRMAVQNNLGLGPATTRFQDQSRANRAFQVAGPNRMAPAYQGAQSSQPPANVSEVPPLVPSMAVPSCGQDCARPQSQIGSDYFDCGQKGCGGCGNEPCCSDRYVRVFGGWNWLQDMEANLQTALVDGRASFNEGWAVGGAIGKYISPRTRRELEFTYRNNTADSITIPAVIPIDGVVNCYSLMGNLVYELPNATIANFKPYFGGGLGVAHVDGEFGGGVASMDDTVFAYQAFAGVDRQLTSNAKLFVEYRYFATSEVEIEAIVPSTDEYETNNLFFGLQLRR